MPDTPTFGRYAEIPYDQMTPEQQLHFSREIAKASTERDKAIAALKLDTTKTVDLATYINEQKAE